MSLGLLWDYFTVDVDPPISIKGLSSFLPSLGDSRHVCFSMSGWVGGEVIVEVDLQDHGGEIASLCR